MKRIIRENTLSTKQHYEFEGTDEQKTDEAWEVTCDYLDNRSKRKLEKFRQEAKSEGERKGMIIGAMFSLGISGYFPLQAMTEFFEGKREFS